MQGDRAARNLAGLDHAVLNLHDVARLDIPARNARRRNQEVVAPPAHRNRTVRTDHQALIAGATHHFHDQAADRPLVRRIGDAHEVRIIRRKRLFVLLDLVVGQIRGLAQRLGVDDRAGAELERLEALVRVHQVLAAQHDAVILHDDGFVVGVILELGGDFLTEALTARNIVRRETDLTANALGLRNDVRIGYLVRDAERYECGRMRVDDGGHFRTHLVDGLVERKFRRRLVRTDDRSVRLHADDVFRGQRSLVDTARRDPDVTVLVFDRDVASRSGSQSAPVDATDDDRDLVGRMHQLGV